MNACSNQLFTLRQIPDPCPIDLIASKSPVFEMQFIYGLQDISGFCDENALSPDSQDVIKLCENLVCMIVLA